MNFIKSIFIALIILIPINSYSGTNNTGLIPLLTDGADQNVLAYYDLRDRSSYIQITHVEDIDNPICIHVQIYQQDKDCSELDFNDQLTINDTVIYDLDNLVRNDGSEIPINLDDDSYGFVAISAVNCSNNNENGSPLIGNFRIVDDSGYEYRMNLMADLANRNILEPNSTRTAFANIIIPFNTVDGATYADIVGFVVDDDRDLSGNAGIGSENFDKIFNDPTGVTFSVFQIDENEERLSCDQKTFACGPGKTMNYGVNDDLPNSKGGPPLCEGGGLQEGQTNGYISLENARYTSEILGPVAVSQFFCIRGLNNGNGTGSMDECQFVCVDGGNNCVDF